MGEFRMPSLGADMDEGRLIEWLIKPGDRVRRGDIVAVVDTPKAVMDIESFEDGVVERLLTEPGTTLPVGAPMAIFGAGDGFSAVPPPPVAPEPAAPQVESPLVRRRAHELGLDMTAIVGTGPGGLITREDVEKQAPPVPVAPAVPAVPAQPVAAQPLATAFRVSASPFARRRATELGIDLATVLGTGPGGAVTADDVERAAVAPPTPAPTPTIEPAPTTQPAPVPKPASAIEPTDAETRGRAMRQAIGNLMARSKREIPHYYLSTTIDLSKAMAWLHDANIERPISSRLVPAALLLKAVALGVRKTPEINGFWVDDAFVPGAGAHIGVAVALRQGGLVAPAIHDADTLSVDDLMARLRDLVTRARTGRLRQSEMDPTITVTNLGDQGVEAVFGVIYPPQVALVGFGRVTERPWADGGMLGVRPCVTATLSADHRASDGHRGGLFLAAIDDLLQRPEAL